jgi:hypothetical protein
LRNLAPTIFGETLGYDEPRFLFANEIGQMVPAAPGTMGRISKAGPSRPQGCVAVFQNSNCNAFPRALEYAPTPRPTLPVAIDFWSIGSMQSVTQSRRPDASLQKKDRLIPAGILIGGQSLISRGGANLLGMDNGSQNKNQSA